MNPESKMTKLSECVEKAMANTDARTRITTLFDEDTFVELDALAGMGEELSGVVAGYGYIGESMVYAFSQDVKACGGAITKTNAKKIKKIYDMAVKTGCPVVSIYDSNGAKVSEANEMLDAYADILVSANNLSGVVPQIALVLGTCAGTSALLACAADMVVMSEKAELFLNAPFVTTAKGQDKEAGSAAFVAKAGIASIVAKDDEKAIEEVRKIVSYLPQNNLAPSPLFDADANAEEANIIANAYADVANMDAMEVIKALSNNDSVVELQADFAKGAVVAFGLVSGAPVGFVANNEINGEFDGQACDKIARFVRFCDAFNMPVVTLVNTKGFEVTAFPCLIRKASKLAHTYAETTSPKITVICGQAIGSAYIAIASNKSSDVTVAWPTAVVSAMPLTAAVEFMSHDKLKGTTDLEASREALVEEYIDQTAGAFKLAENGYVDAVIDPADTKMYVVKAIEMLASKRVSNLPKKHSVMPL